MFVTIVSLLFIQPALAVTEKAILGTWVNAEGDGIIEITQQQEMFIGTITGSTSPDSHARRDINNPDPDLRDRPLQGVEIIQGITYKKENLWAGGLIYDPNNGKTYNCKLSLNEDGTLSIRGYAGLPLFGRTEVWTRADNSIVH